MIRSRSGPIPSALHTENTLGFRTATLSLNAHEPFSRMKIKHLFSCAVGVFAAAFIAHAESSVWKVSKGENALYLGGTSHLLRPADFPLPPEFDEAYAAASAVYFETDIKRSMSAEMQQIVQQRGMLPEGRTLESVLSPRAWKRVQTYCAQRGLPLGQFAKLRPWLFLTMIGIMEIQKLGVTQEGVDMHFFQRATADQKTIGELESFEHHIDYITNLAAGHESEMIEQSLDDLAALPKDLDDLLSGWRKGDLAPLDKLMHEEMRAKYPAIYSTLLVERNNNWLPVIERLVATPETEFVLAGIGHMVGPDGLLAQLQKRGYAIEQIKASRAN